MPHIMMQKQELYINPNWCTVTFLLMCFIFVLTEQAFLPATKPISFFTANNTFYKDSINLGKGVNNLTLRINENCHVVEKKFFF